MKPTKKDRLHYVRYGIGANLIIALFFIAPMMSQYPIASIAGIIALCGISVTMYVFLIRFRKNLTKELSLLSHLAPAEYPFTHIKALRTRENEITTYLTDLSQKKVDSKPGIVDDSSFGKALQAIAGLVDRYETNEQKIHWSQGGLARFAEIVKEGDSIEEFSVGVISHLVKYIGANQGGMYVEETGIDNQRFMELKGCYAYDKRKFLTKRIFPGEGMLGECMLDRTLHYIKDIPQNYVHITSGLGEATPRNLVILPLIFQEEFVGAIELASFKVLQQHELDFLKKVSESIAGEVASRKRLHSMQHLLSDSQLLAETLRGKEEEMRQQVEELTSTQEEMKRHEAELHSLFSAINNTVASAEFDLSGNILMANDIFLSISGFRHEEIKKHNYTYLLAASEKGKPQHTIMWENLKEGKHFSGEFRLVDKNMREIFITGTFNPILDSRGRPVKVIMIGHFTSEEKTKLLELHNVVAATKNSVPYVELSGNFEYKSANERFLKLFGIKRIELKNKNFASLLDKKIVDECKARVSSANQNYFEADLAYQINHESYLFRTSFTVLRDNENNVTRILVILSDQLVANKIAAVA